MQMYPGDFESYYTYINIGLEGQAAQYLSADGQYMYAMINYGGDDGFATTNLPLVIANLTRVYFPSNNIKTGLCGDSIFNNDMQRCA